MEEPAAWRREADALRAARPRTLVFMCIQNSARSQMAEGLALSLAPPGLRILSAGSNPSSVRPFAVQAMAEIGIDISRHRSKGLDAIPLDEVDGVITLCSDVVCPTLPGVQQLHWPIPDPAAAGVTPSHRLEAYRDARDAIVERLRYLFDGWV